MGQPEVWDEPETWETKDAVSSEKDEEDEIPF
jgi:hypothetical protein